MGLSYQCFIIEKISEVDETIIDNLKIEEKNVETLDGVDEEENNEEIEVL